MSLKIVQCRDCQKKVASDLSGDIFKVQDATTGKNYSLKYFIDINNAKKEINIISRLNYPSILKFIGFSQKAQTSGITESLIQNNLETVLYSKNPPPPWNDTNKLIIIYGIASGMSYILSKGITYCCLTAKNILLDENFHPKISDFSYARHGDDDLGDITIENNDYLAPEVIQENR